jgi:Holliday junction resolvase
MSRSQRDKGARVEREIVERLAKIGVFAEKVPLSGGARYRGEGHDVDVYAFGKGEEPLVAEVKARANGEGFAMLERWLGKFGLLFLRRDRADPLVVMPWSTFERYSRRSLWGDLLEDTQDIQHGLTSAPRAKTSAKPELNGGNE